MLIVSRGGPKNSPCIVYSAVYFMFFILVFGDQQKYSEKSECIIGLDYSICFSFRPHFDFYQFEDRLHCLSQQ